MAKVARIATAKMKVDHGGAESYLSEMSDQDIARFRMLAEESRLQASRSISEADKQAWLRMAREWDSLANAAQRFRDRG